MAGIHTPPGSWLTRRSTTVVQGKLIPKTTVQRMQARYALARNKWKHLGGCNVQRGAAVLAEIGYGCPTGKQSTAGLHIAPARGMVDGGVVEVVARDRSEWARKKMNWLEGE